MSNNPTDTTSTKSAQRPHLAEAQPTPITPLDPDKTVIIDGKAFAIVEEKAPVSERLASAKTEAKETASEVGSKIRTGAAVTGYAVVTGLETTFVDGPVALASGVKKVVTTTGRGIAKVGHTTSERRQHRKAIRSVARARRAEKRANKAQAEATEAVTQAAQAVSEVAETEARTTNES